LLCAPRTAAKSLSARLFGVSFRDGETFTLVKIESVFLNQSGKDFRAALVPGIGPKRRGGRKTPVPYQWSVVTDSALSLRWSRNEGGQNRAALSLTAKLIQKGGPLALPATVWARVARRWRDRQLAGGLQGLGGGTRPGTETRGERRFPR